MALTCHSTFNGWFRSSLLDSVLYSKGHFPCPSNKHPFSLEMLSLKIHDRLLSFFTVFPSYSVGFVLNYNGFKQEKQEGFLNRVDFYESQMILSH